MNKPLDFIIEKGVLVKYKGATQDVIIPNGVKTIKTHAFFLNFTPRTITIQNGVKTIEKFAISDCPNLLKVTIPQTVTKVGMKPFDGSWHLTEITNYSKVCIDEPIVTISPNIPIDSYVKNKEEACKGFLLHQDLFTGEIAETYQKYASRQMQKLLPFVFENDLLPALRLFANADRITVRNIETFLNQAKDAKAEQCVNFLLNWSNEHITEEQKGKEKQRKQAEDPYSLEAMRKLWRVCIDKDNKAILAKYKGTETDIFIPGRVGKYPVKKLKDQLFEDNENLTSITLSEGIESLGEGTFELCKSLTSIIIPQSVKRIGENTFGCCLNLASITLPQNLVCIDTYAFLKCLHLKSIIIPDTVKEIGMAAFSECRSLTSINIPKALTRIEMHSFSECDKLTSITIPNNITSIGMYAFYRCFSLTSITIPSSVTSIEQGAFNHCTQLTTISLPESITRIDHRLFKDCSSLVSIALPQSITFIGSEAFKSCTNLEVVVIQNGETNIAVDAFLDCPKLTLRVPANSNAEDYAKEHGFRFETI